MYQVNHISCFYVYFFIIQPQSLFPLDEFDFSSLSNVYRFGTVSFLQQLIPLFSMFFLLTRACGSALWIADLEIQKSTILT